MIKIKMKYLIIPIILCFSNCCSGQNIEIVSVATDNTNEGVYYLNQDGLVVKFINNNQLSTKRDTLIYIYSKTGTVEKVKCLGCGDTDEFNEDVEKKHINDVVYQNNYLMKKGIKFPLPLVNTTELGDMVKVFFCNDKYREETVEREKMFIFDNINKKITFRSNIEKYIQHLTVIKKYKVILKDNFLMKEEYTFDGGKLIRIYHYNTIDKLSSISWNCIYDGDSNKYTENKTFTW